MPIMLTMARRSYKKNKKKRFEDICMGCDLFKDSPEFNSKTWRDK